MSKTTKILLVLISLALIGLLFVLFSPAKIASVPQDQGGNQTAGTDNGQIASGTDDGRKIEIAPNGQKVGDLTPSEMAEEGIKMAKEAVADSFKVEFATAAEKKKLGLPDNAIVQAARDASSSMIISYKVLDSEDKAAKTFDEMIKPQ